LENEESGDRKGKHKVPPTYARALPIHAKNGREWGPEYARSLYGRRDDGGFGWAGGIADIGKARASTTEVAEEHGGKFEQPRAAVPHEYRLG
jgi:hypothetical protein